MTKGKCIQMMLEFEGLTYVDCTRFAGLPLMPRYIGQLWWRLDNNGLYILLGPWYLHLHLHLHPLSRVRISRILSVKGGRLETYILKPRLR